MLAALAAAALLSGAARADLTIGVSVPLTGPASGLGIPAKNAMALWPTTIGGEKVNLIILDDATDPTLGVKNARKLITEDKADVIVGSVATPVAVAMAGVATELQTVQLALSPIELPESGGVWTFRLAHSVEVMSIAMVAHMKTQGVKTVGFVGYSDAYGESWLRDFTRVAKESGISVVAAERYARADTSITGQALKLTSANPDAILIAASGSGSAMPHKALIERGYKGKVYQTHGAASRDLIRLGGKDVEGGFVTSGPVIVADKLPDSNPSKKIGIALNDAYEKAYGAGTRNQFAGHAWDAMLILQKAVPEALKKAKPGTPAFRAALKDAIENGGRIPVSQGVLNYTAKDHWGFTPDTGVVLKIVNGDWKLEPR
ncbi:MAG: ABC transporter substrate-binding protein [Candidatus Protistobacter heckmanni]|nr:ABC transporter substrate-binding protein [Candidatus Protistobacter heckmanni]